MIAEYHRDKVKTMPEGTLARKTRASEAHGNSADETDEPDAAETATHDDTRRRGGKLFQGFQG